MKSNPMMLKVAEYAPDQPTLRLQGDPATTDIINNVLPRTDRGYGALQDFQRSTQTPLPSPAHGAYFAADPVGNTAVFAATTTDLYRIQAGQTAFSNVSKSTAAYLCPNDENWSFTQFGPRLIAANIHDPMQSFIMGTSTKFADLAAAAPKARFVTVIKNFLMAANTWDAVGGYAPWRSWWSALGDPTNWPTPGTAAAQAVQSDYNDIVGEAGQITGIVGNLGTADGALFFEHAVFRINYVGPPAIFNFVPAEGVRGCPAPGSIAQLGATVFYFGEDGFYLFDGVNSIPIGANKVDRTFIEDVDPASYGRITACVDPLNKVVIWSYTSRASWNAPPAYPNWPFCDKMLIYNWVTQRWGTATINVDLLFRSTGFGYTLDGLDATGYTLDTLPYSLDSRAWNGGGLLLGAFQNGYLGYFQGPTLAAQLQTEEIQPFPGQRTFVRNTRPIVNMNPASMAGDPDEPGYVAPNITVVACVRDAVTSSSEDAQTGVLNRLGYAPLRSSARYMRFEINVGRGVGFDNIQGIEIDASPVGVR